MNQSKEAFEVSMMPHKAVETIPSTKIASVATASMHTRTSKQTRVGILKKVEENIREDVPVSAVWDIEVDVDHSFLASGIVVHNCVGAGGGRAQTHAALGDMIFRGEQEEVHLPFWLPTYGIGREIAGMRNVGSGSFGAAQAKAIERFGHIHRDWDQADKPRIKDGWLIYDDSVELKWSHPKGWRIDRATVEAEAEKNQIRDVTRITTLEGLIQALSQGYGVTAASSFGTRPRVDSSVDLLVGPWNGSWAHQMAWSGYTKRGGKYYVCCDNQWGPTHGTCPTLSKIGGGVYGSFWIPEGDVESVIRRGEVYAHSNTEGFPPKKIDWGQYSGFQFD